VTPEPAPSLRPPSAGGVLRVRRLTDGARPPRRAEPGAGGYDLYACGEQAGRLIRTGVAVEIPPGWVGLIRDRSGVALAGRGFTVAGVIDSSYRGEVGIVFDREVTVADGERIAQLVIVPHFDGEVTEVPALSASARGAAGFGSTGSHG
jgi:dUTP pyrophosphatase